MNQEKVKKIEKYEDIIFSANGKSKNVHVISLHFSKGRGYDYYPCYTFNVLKDGSVLQFKRSAVGVKLRHTWDYNEGNIAISASAMHEAVYGNYGAYPVSELQKDTIAILGAMLIKHFNWTMEPLREESFCNYLTNSEDTMPIYRVMTHGELACLHKPSYGPGSPCMDSNWEFYRERHEMRERIAEKLTKGQFTFGNS